MKKSFFIFFLCFFCKILFAQTLVSIPSVEQWTTDDVAGYVGQTVQFDVPFIVSNNYSYKSQTLTVAPRRLYEPTNQVAPGGSEYSTFVQKNSASEVSLTGIDEYHRMGEKIVNLVVKISSKNSWEFVSGTWMGATRASVENALPNVDINGEHTLLVCAMNLEYYLVENFGTGYGPDNAAYHTKQRAKVSDALSKINADIYGLVEVQQGQGALAEIAADLTNKTGRKFSYVVDNTAVSGSYTKSGYVYCTETVIPYKTINTNNTSVKYRKQLQAFAEKSTGGRFIFSINHFKAKTGNGTGSDADQNDGQGKFNATRVKEAQSVVTNYNSNKTYYEDEDILVMGDLNAYAKEDPIVVFLDEGFTDLHRHFHADTSYSYVYRGHAGYLDHALANSTLLGQITGMGVWHINADEHDNFTYEKGDDQTLFRCSDHDPVLVGLKLTAQTTALTNAICPSYIIAMADGQPCIRHAENSVYRLYHAGGQPIANGKITSDEYRLPINLSKGFYILYLQDNQTVNAFKILIY